MTRRLGWGAPSWCRTMKMIPCFLLLCGCSYGLHARQHIRPTTPSDETRIPAQRPIVGSKADTHRTANRSSGSSNSSRRDVFRESFGVLSLAAAAAAAAVARPSVSRASSFALDTATSSSTPSSSSSPSPSSSSRFSHPFVYSDSWTGTRLTIRTLNEATASGAYTHTQTHTHTHAKSAEPKPKNPNQNDGDDGDDGDDCDSVSYHWEMGRWPDPALRVPATPVDPAFWRGEEQQQRLRLAATILRDTARSEGAVGLAAQQCGVDARMVYLSSSSSSSSSLSGSDRVLINPRIVARSPESSMRVWTEECLVLPPTFRATVLRDDWIDVEYDCSYEYYPNSNSNSNTNANPKNSESHPSRGTSPRFVSSSGNGAPLRRRFFGERSRCLQHELDHDRGILITDHVGLDELESDAMRRIEAEGHDRRQAAAYSRSVL